MTRKRDGPPPRRRPPDARRVVISTSSSDLDLSCRSRRRDRSRSTVFFLIALTYGLTIIYAGTLRYVDRRRWLVDLQLAVDGGDRLGVHLVDGGITSNFTSLYFLPVIAAKHDSLRRGGLLIATLSAALYGALVAAQYLRRGGSAPSRGSPRPRRPAGRLGGALHRRAECIRLLRRRAARGLARRQPAIRRRAARAGVERDRDLQALNKHVIDSLRAASRRPNRSHRIPDVQPRRRGDHGRAVPRRGRPADCRRAAAAAGRDGDDSERADSERGRRRYEYRFSGRDGRGELEIGLTATHSRRPAAAPASLHVPT